MTVPPLPKQRTRLVRASKLPATFEIPTTWYCKAYCSATRVGRKVCVICMGQRVLLGLSQRVRILVEAA
jgi:hypothetical protein